MITNSDVRYQIGCQFINDHIDWKGLKMSSIFFIGILPRGRKRVFNNKSAAKRFIIARKVEVQPSGLPCYNRKVV